MPSDTPTIPSDGGRVDRLLPPGEVAKLFNISSKTVRRWSERGWLDAVRLPSGHRRYWESEVRRLLDLPFGPDEAK